MHRPMISIRKKRLLANPQYYRYYEVAKFALDPSDNRWQRLVVNTEKELVSFIYNQFGQGDYRLLAFVKGRRGLWVFWDGNINEQGWHFNTRFQKSSEVRRLNRELQEAIAAGDEEMVQGIKEDLEFQKEQDKTESKEKKYGFAPYLRSSGKRGVFHMWEEPDMAFKEEQSEDIYG